MGSRSDTGGVHPPHSQHPLTQMSHHYVMYFFTLLSASFHKEGFTVVSACPG